VEAYLQKRTDAHFTHGICPPCQSKLLAETGDGIPIDGDCGD
jgi:hypothetical protein